MYETERKIDQIAVSKDAYERARAAVRYAKAVVQIPMECGGTPMEDMLTRIFLTFCIGK
jgi:tRNA U34 5-carboxymethylaminomethyl modifying GTPase MnmE/TrmE